MADFVCQQCRYVLNGLPRTQAGLVTCSECGLVQVSAKAAIRVRWSVPTVAVLSGALLCTACLVPVELGLIGDHAGISLLFSACLVAGVMNAAWGLRRSLAGGFRVTLFNGPELLVYLISATVLLAFLYAMWMRAAIWLVEDGFGLL